MNSKQLIILFLIAILSISACFANVVPRQVANNPTQQDPSPAPSASQDPQPQPSQDPQPQPSQDPQPQPSQSVNPQPQPSQSVNPQPQPQTSQSAPSSTSNPVQTTSSSQVNSVPTAGSNNNRSTTTSSSTSTATSSSTNNALSDDNKDEGGLSTMSIVLIVIGSVVAVGVIVIIYVRTRSSGSKDDFNPTFNTTPINDTYSPPAPAPVQYYQPPPTTTVYNQGYDQGYDQNQVYDQNQGYDQGYQQQQQYDNQYDNQYAQAAAPVVTQPAQPMQTPDGMQITPGSIHTALYMFKPDLDDELYLQAGETVEIIEVYDDGWALGKNLNSDEQGVFPLNRITGVEELQTRYQSLNRPTQN